MVRCDCKQENKSYDQKWGKNKRKAYKPQVIQDEGRWESETCIYIWLDSGTRVIVERIQQDLPLGCLERIMHQMKSQSSKLPLL